LQTNNWIEKYNVPSRLIGLLINFIGGILTDKGIDFIAGGIMLFGFLMIIGVIKFNLSNNGLKNTKIFNESVNPYMYQPANRILVNRNGGYLRNTNEVMDVLFFIENGGVLRAYIEKDNRLAHFVKNNAETKKLYDLAVNDELRSKLFRSAGRWNYHSTRNEIKINFAIGDDIIRCKLRTSGILVANIFLMNENHLTKKEICEYKPCPEIFWWAHDMPNPNQNGKRFIIT